MAKDCRATPFYRHYSSEHEMTECIKKMDPPRCGNCAHTRGLLSGDLTHSATNATKCPILDSKIKDKIAYINYD